MRSDGLTDEHLLTALDLIWGGASKAEVARRFGMTPNTINGALFRVERELAASEAAPGPKAIRPENQDGALGRGWWKAGVRLQKVPARSAKVKPVTKPKVKFKPGNARRFG